MLHNHIAQLAILQLTCILPQSSGASMFYNFQHQNSMDVIVHSHEAPNNQHRAESLTNFMYVLQLSGDVLESLTAQHESDRSNSYPCHLSSVDSCYSRPRRDQVRGGLLRVPECQGHHVLHLLKTWYFLNF